MAEGLDLAVRRLEGDRLGSSDPARNSVERLAVVSQLHRDAAGDPKEFGRSVAAYLERNDAEGRDSGRHMTAQQKYVLDCFFKYEPPESMI